MHNRRPARSIVRELVGYMMRKARRNLTAGELARFAERVGAVDTPSSETTSSRM